ncbi:TPA: hypothetical protein RI785_003171 [Vibrio cholerae]|nr:hypothetical protein [Vibrio cholerae]
MSYYNQMYFPTRDSKSKLRNGKLDFMVFTEADKGFDFLVNEIGIDFVQINQDTNKREMIFVQVDGGSDFIRPSNLDWDWSNQDVKYGDADCFIYAHDLHNRINWINVEDIEATEKAIFLYQRKVQKHGEKLIILPV